MAGIVGRADLLCAVFVLLAFLSYVKVSLTDYEEDSDLAGHFYMVLCVLLTITATLCKEQGITTLVRRGRDDWGFS